MSIFFLTFLLYILFLHMCAGEEKSERRVAVTENEEARKFAKFLLTEDEYTAAINPQPRVGRKRKGVVLEADSAEEEKYEVLAEDDDDDGGGFVGKDSDDRDLAVALAVSVAAEQPPTLPFLSQHSGISFSSSSSSNLSSRSSSSSAAASTRPTSSRSASRAKSSRATSSSSVLVSSSSSSSAAGARLSANPPAHGLVPSHASARASTSAGAARLASSSAPATTLSAPVAAVSASGAKKGAAYTDVGEIPKGKK